MSDSRKEIVAECHEAAYRAYEEVGPMQYALEGPAGLVGRMLRAINAVASRPAAPRCDAGTEVGHWLFMCRYNRSLRSWIKPGSYAWFRIGDDLKEWQSRLADFRRRRASMVSRPHGETP